MYSIVLMAALASAGDTPNWGHGCGGCGGYGHGCYGSYGHGCYGGYGYGCYGCWGGYGYGCGGYGCGGYGCGGYGYGCGGYGCGGYGYGGCCGGGYYSPYHVTPTVAPARPAEVAPPPKEKTGAAANQAKLLVELPADAKLFIDDQPMKTPAARRTFNTPALQPGQAYYYIVRAEVVIDGKTHTETKQIIVRAGQTAEAKFTELLAKVEASKAPAAVADAQ